MQTDKNPLNEADLAGLRASFITKELAEKAGLSRVSDSEGKALTGSKHLDCSGIAYPVRAPGGQTVAYAVRRDNPEIDENGKTKRKYLYEVGFRNNLFNATNVTEADLQNVDLPLAYSEGPKKCLAMERMQTEGKKNFRAMSLAGVHNIKTTSYKTTDARGCRIDKKDVIADLNNTKFSDGEKSRTVYIVFDSNCRKEVNKNVYYARIKFAQLLRHRGATVKFVNLPLIDGVNGIDDLLGLYEKEFGAEAAIEKVWELFEQAELFVSRTNFIVIDDGVFYKSTTTDKKGNTTSENQFVCSKLEITAKTRDEHGSNWGRLLQWADDDGREHTWAMPASLLSGDGTEVRARLLSEGLLVSSQRKAQALLSEYLQSYETFHKITCVSRIGWHGKSYIFPNQTITRDENKGAMVYQSDSFDGDKLKTSGTLEDWRSNVARLCVGNSRLCFAVSCAFASVLLSILGEDGFGAHFRAPSSLGKTTTLLVGGSVFGGSSANGFLDSWKATDNSFEATAETHNDGLLCLDEIGECDPFKVASIVYMLGNKVGKGRMNRSATLRKRYAWNILFLSSGEISLSDILTQTGQKIRGGQSVRLIDVEADAGAGFGLFETLHEFATAHELADALRENSKQFYGTAIRGFLEKLVNTDFDAEKNRWHTRKANFLDSVLPEDASGEIKRVATKFALAAFAGEGAAEITGWAVGTAADACRTIFNSWLKNQCASAPSDAENAVKQVRQFIEAHGQSRFQSATTLKDFNGNDISERVSNRVGFRRTNETTGEIEFLILPESFRTEVCKGFDAKFVANALADRNYLLKAGDGKDTRNAKCAEMGQKRVYVINASIFEKDPEVKTETPEETQGFLCLED
jgi:uncharacterized protein (DUF927 family)